MAEATQGIAVFLDDRASYDITMARYHARVPAYIYLCSDGPSPKTVPSDRIRNIGSYWNGQSKFPVDGICQETCRDLVHTGSGLSSVAHVAETSRIQGSNLYQGDIGRRLRSALELHSHLQMYGNSEKWLCGDHLKGGLPPGLLAPLLPSFLQKKNRLNLKNSNRSCLQRARNRSRPQDALYPRLDQEKPPSLEQFPRHGL